MRVYETGDRVSLNPKSKYNGRVYQVSVGTPSRVMDCRSNTLGLNHLNCDVIDELTEALNSYNSVADLLPYK